MDETAKQTGEVTINSAIQELEKVSWRLNGLVFGESPVENGIGNQSQPADKLTFLRNSIIDATQRLKEVANRLEIIGK
jgi:hypothetical protein